MLSFSSIEWKRVSFSVCKPGYYDNPGTTALDCMRCTNLWSHEGSSGTNECNSKFETLFQDHCHSLNKRRISL